MADINELHIGDSITINPGALNVSANPSYNGLTYNSSVYSTVYKVWSVGSSALGPEYISFGLDGESSPTGGQWASAVTLVNSDAAKETETEDVPVQDETENENLPDEGTDEANQIDEELVSIMNAAYPEDIYKFNMRLFGIPHQFTNYTDYRTFYSKDRAPETTIGRKFLEAIMLEAPVLTVIPGKPYYLPGAKNKIGITEAFLQSANEISGLWTALTDEDRYAELRYYDFEQDYYHYMEYVNILCQTTASFLDLKGITMQCGSEELPLTAYKWQNYRWNEENYKNAFGNVMSGMRDAVGGALNAVATGIIDVVKSIGLGDSGNSKALDMVSGDNVESRISVYEGVTMTAFDNQGENDEDFISSVETLLRGLNFVQFYVDASTGISESIENTTGASKLAETFNAGETFLKEAAFVANSGGVSAEDYQNLISGAVEGINQATFDKFTSNDAGSLLNRLFSSVSNVIKGENMIFPDIYQSSKYTKNYSFTIDLRSPYGNKISYYLNVVVPLMHLIALALPKQSTANSYSSPFLVKCYYPGICACNLGIVSSMTIDKNPSGESWTVDGYPSEIRVTMNVTDLYSELSMVPSGIAGIRLFVSNASLIEYLAVQCGIDLISPQMETKGNMMLNVISNAFVANWDSVGQYEAKQTQKLLDSFLMMF